MPRLRRGSRPAALDAELHRRGDQVGVASRDRLRRRLAASALLAAALGGTARADAVPEWPEPGARGVALTVVEGSRIEEIPVRYVGLQRDYLGPGYDLHLVELEGPVAERVGVASGMSGSPVYVDGRLLGSLSYRIGSLPKSPIGGVTPIESLRASDPGAGAGPAAPAGSGRPIGTPLQIGRLPARVRAFALGELERYGFVPVAGGGGSRDATGETGPRPEPGSAIGVALVRGDLELAAFGTVTLVEGDRVWAFGHPFLGTGPVEMPLVSASVVHTLADLAGSFKMSTAGPEVGVVLEDRLTAIVGRLDRRARMIPLTVGVRVAGRPERRYAFELARHRDLTPLLATVSAASALTESPAWEPESTLLARGRVVLRGLPDLPIESSAAWNGTTDPAITVAVGLQRVLLALWQNPFEEPPVERIELEVEGRVGTNAYRLDGVSYDRGPLRPGQSLELRCRLRSWRGGEALRTIEVPLPRDLARDADLAVVVGTPDAIEAALGQPGARRARDAGDLEDVVRLLAERRSSHRLVAALIERREGVVAGANAYVGLPPSATRLIEGSIGGRDQASLRVGEIARREIELDGPLEGSWTARVRVDAGLEIVADEP